MATKDVVSAVRLVDAPKLDRLTAFTCRLASKILQGVNLLVRIGIDLTTDLDLQHAESCLPHRKFLEPAYYRLLGLDIF